MNYSKIKDFDIANGPGVRVSLFVSGCTHHCKGCFNPETWDFDAGQPYTEETEYNIILKLGRSFITGLTLLGGEPMEPDNQVVLVKLLKKVRTMCPSIDIWCYTGYTLENDLMNNGRAVCEVTEEMLSYIDVLVDGEFVEEKKNISLVFRGSENQRIIDLQKTLKSGKVVTLEGIYDRI